MVAQPDLQRSYNSSQSAQKLLFKLTIYCINKALINYDRGKKSNNSRFNVVTNSLSGDIDVKK